jgi:ferredoxin
MAVSSVAIAAPFIVDMAGPVPVVKEAMAAGKTYYIGHKCIGCQVCRLKCPSSAINYGDDRNEIDQEKCKHCGTCYRNCPISVITEI